MTIYSLTRVYNDPNRHKLAQWVASMMSASEGTAKKIGCSPEAIVAQAALESAWGRASIGNNVFGIKADPAWTGARLLRRTAEQYTNGAVYYVDAWFRDYPTLAAGIDDHFDFLQRNTRYAGVFDPDGSKSDRDYFQAMKAAGYATDVDYVDKLCAVKASVQQLTAEMQRSDGIAPVVAPVLTLAVGSEGTDVRRLQDRLNAIGFPAGTADGKYGARTYAAVKAFQGARNLHDVDGIAGPATRAELGII